MADKIQLLIREILLLSNVREVITENVLLLKYQKQAITAALNGKHALVLLLTALRKLWIYHMLPFIIGRDTSLIRNKFANRETY